MMPMAGQDAVLDTAAIEGKTHMRAAIVEGEYTPTFKDEEDWPVATAHHKTPLGLQLFKATRVNEIRGRHAQGDDICQAKPDDVKS